MILVTGATGHLGSLVVEALLNKIAPTELAVSVRQPEKAESLRARGVDVRYGDFDKPETLQAAFGGIDRLLIISTDGDTETRIRQHKAAIAAAKQAKVGFIAYTSVTHADTSSLFLAEVHRTTEEEIRKSGIPYCFLRNNWYLENEISTIEKAIKGEPWLTAAGGGKVGWAPRRDFAEAAAQVLAQGGHEHTIYELSGQPHTHEQFAAILSKICGKPINVQHVSIPEYKKILQDNKLPEPLIAFLILIEEGIQAGTLDVASNDLEKLLGRPATPLDEALGEIVRQLQG